MTELLLKLIPPTTSAMFAVGGTGFKWVRRYLLPLLIGLTLWQVCWWKAVIIAATVGAGLTLPYGDSLPNKYLKWVSCLVTKEVLTWILRLLVLSTYFLPFLILGWNIWALVGLMVSFGLFIASNSKFQKIVPWWVWEPITGFLMGVACITCL